MVRVIVAALIAVVSTVSRAAQLVRKPLAARDTAPDCNAKQKHAVLNYSKILRTNPAGWSNHSSEILFRSGSGEVCAYAQKEEHNPRHILVDLHLPPNAVCCSKVERGGMSADEAGVLRPFAANAFASMNRSQLKGVPYVQVQPDQGCPPDGCPLVVEISGNAGRPWLMVRKFCENCNKKLGVVMISPVTGEHEDTGFKWIHNKFNPFVRAYLDKHSGSLVDRRRVYMVSASRGNEIGVTAALDAPDVWKFVLLTGKFEFTGDMMKMMRKPNIFSTARKAGLRKLSFHIGDEDPILSDEEFYSNFTKMLKLNEESGPGAAMVQQTIYPGMGHDTSPGVWSKMIPLIWSGKTDL